MFCWRSHGFVSRTKHPTKPISASVTPVGENLRKAKKFRWDVVFGVEAGASAVGRGFAASRLNARHHAEAFMAGFLAGTELRLDETTVRNQLRPMRGFYVGGNGAPN